MVYYLRMLITEQQRKTFQHDHSFLINQKEPNINKEQLQFHSCDEMNQATEELITCYFKNTYQGGLYQSKQEGAS